MQLFEELQKLAPQLVTHIPVEVEQKQPPQVKLGSWPVPSAQQEEQEPFAQQVPQWLSMFVQARQKVALPVVPLQTASMGLPVLVQVLTRKDSELQLLHSWGERQLPLTTVRLIDDTLVNTLPATFSAILSKLPEVLLLEQQMVESVQRESVNDDRSLAFVTVTVLLRNRYWEGMVTTTTSPARNLFVELMVSVNCCTWFSFEGQLPESSLMLRVTVFTALVRVFVGGVSTAELMLQSVVPDFQKVRKQILPGWSNDRERIMLLIERTQLVEAASALPRVVQRSLEFEESTAQLPLPARVQESEEEKAICVLELPVFSSSVEMASPTLMTEGEVIWKVQVVGFPFILLVVLLVTASEVSSALLVRGLSVAPDCSMVLPSPAQVVSREQTGLKEQQLRSALMEIVMTVPAERSLMMRLEKLKVSVLVEEVVAAVGITVCGAVVWLLVYFTVKVHTLEELRTMNAGKLIVRQPLALNLEVTMQVMVQREYCIFVLTLRVTSKLPSVIAAAMGVTVSPVSCELSSTGFTSSVELQKVSTRKELDCLAEMGLRILETATVTVVLLGKAAENMLVMKMTELEDAVQLLLELIAPPNEEVTVAVQTPLAMQRSEGRVIRMPPPEASGFRTVTTKVQVVSAETVGESGATVADMRELGMTVMVAFPLAKLLPLLKTCRKRVLVPLFTRDLIVNPPDSRKVIPEAKESLLAATGQVTPLVMLPTVNRLLLAMVVLEPRKNEPPLPALVAATERQVVLEASTWKLKVSVVKVSAMGVTKLTSGLRLFPTQKVEEKVTVTVMGQSVTERLQLLVSIELKKEAVQRVVSVKEQALRAVVGGVISELPLKVRLVPAETFPPKKEVKMQVCPLFEMIVLPFSSEFEFVLMLVSVLPVVQPDTLSCSDPPAGMLFLGVS